MLPTQNALTSCLVVTIAKLWTNAVQKKYVMIGWVLWIMIVQYVPGMGQVSENCASDSGAVCSISPLNEIVALHNLLIGRVLASCIREGMTGREVDQVLGGFVVDRSQYGPLQAYWIGYSKLGITIEFARNKDARDDWFRVVRVRYGVIPPLPGGR